MDFDNMGREQYLAAIRIFRPDVTDEEFERMWVWLQKDRAERARRKAMH